MLPLRPIGATVARQIPVLKVTRSNRVSVTDAVSDGTIPAQARAARASRSTSRAPPSTASSRTSCARAATSRAATVPRPRPMHIWGCSSVAERPLCMRKAQGSNPCSSTHTKTTPWRNGQRIRLRIWGLRVRVPSELFAFARRRDAAAATHYHGASGRRRHAVAATHHTTQNLDGLEI